MSKVKKVWSLVMCVLAMAMCSAPALAQGTETVAAGDGSFLNVKAMALFAAALAIGIGTIAPAAAQGNAIARAMEAIGRNPECAGKVQTLLLIGLAFVESLCIYALVIAFMAIGYAK